MKKKNMAILMAGVTVATTVAPAFANGENATNQKETSIINAANAEKLVKEIEKALNVKYQETKAGAELGTCAYDTQLDGAELKSHITLENEIKELKNGESIKVTIQDKGHQVIANKVVDYKIEKYETVSEILDAVKLNVELTAKQLPNNIVEVKKGEDVIATVTVGDDKLDFTKIVTDNEGKATGFETKYTKIEAGKINEIIVRNSTELEATDLVNGYFLTAKGNELAERLLKEETAGKTIEIIDNNEDLGFAGSFDIAIKEADKVVEIIGISSHNPSAVNATKVLLQDKLNNTSRVDLMAGEDRYKTAVEISKATFSGSTTASSIVFVGKDAIVDGLAAAPLAAQENAPILLANGKELTKETEEEMLRLLGDDLKSKTIYLVGGTTKIAPELEEKLNKLGVKAVERIAGEDRYETSLAIAKKLDATQNTTNKAFVVGGAGEADAMSISAKAAELNAPIIVTNKEKLTDEAAKFLTGKELEIIGGVNSVTESLEAKLQTVDNDKTVVRLAGETRKDTNAKVINAYYQDATEVFVAKDGNAALIDALAAAPLAGKQNAPIVLSTNGLSTMQETAVENKLTKVEKITQVGNGISAIVIEKIVELVGLFK